MSETIGRGVIELSADATKLNAAINDARRSIKSLGDSTATSNQRAAASIDRYVKGLQTSAAVQGRTTRETELYKLALRGATDEQLRAANSALKLTEGYQRGIAIGDKLRSNARVLGQGLVAIGVAAGVGALAFDRLIKNAGNFQDISEKIGDTAESVASLAVAAGTTGTAIDSIAGASVKLTKALTGVDDESKGAGAAVAALGLDLGSFKQLAPVDQLEGIAKALNGFADGPEKAAIAMALFGKAGADLLPFLKELGAEGGRQVVLTTAQIKAADEYTDSQAKLRTEIGLYAQSIAADVLPVITDFIKGAKSLISEVSGIGAEARKLGGNTEIADFAESGALFLANLIDVARRVGQAFSYVGQTIGVTAAIAASASRGSVDATKAAFSFNPSGVVDVATRQAREIAEIVKSAREQGEKEFGAFNSFADKVETSIANRKKSAAEIASQSAFPSDARFYRKPPDDRPKIDTRNIKGTPKIGGSSSDPAAREAEQIRRAELDADLRFLRDKLGEERATIAFNERERQALYQAGNASLREFYVERNAEIARGVQTELNLLTDEQARLEVELGRVKDPSERIRLQAQLDESVARSGNVAVEAARAARLGTLEEAAAFKQLNDTVTDYRANLLQLQGDEEGASRLRAQQAIEQAKVLAKQSGGQISAKNIADLALAEAQTTRINAAKTASSVINERLQMQEERIALAQKSGAITEIAALQQIGAARAGSIAAAEAQVKALEKLAAERPLDIQVNLDAERARLELDKLYASLDPLKDKFDEVFRQSGAGAIADFLDGTKSAKEALKDFGKSILSSINANVAKQASEQLFGKDGILGGAGGFVSSLFGGGAAKGPAQAAGGLLGAPTPAVDTSSIAASFSSLQSAGITPTIDAFARLQQATDAAAGAVSSSAGDVASTAGTTGEQSIADLFREPADQSASLSTALADTRKTTLDYSAATAQAASTIASLAGAGSNASTALGLLPSIINAISAASATTSSAGGGSGWIDTIFSLAASAYGGSSGMATNNTGTSLPTSGGRALGGPVSAGSIQPITERGPEILRVGSQQYLMMGSQGGFVTPNSGGGAGGGQPQPVMVTNNFTVSGPIDRRSEQQIAAAAGGAVQRATKRIR